MGMREKQDNEVAGASKAIAVIAVVILAVYLWFMMRAIF